MTKKLKKPPQFKSEAAEREFWATHDTTAYFDSAKTIRATFPNLRPSTQTISLRLPKHLLDRIKAQANAKDVPYQSLIKVWLSQKTATEK
ncbi:MAG: BrnA antitoxin family protein [Gammaproteobacteria bacterium]